MITLRAYQNKKLGIFGLGKAGSATISALQAGGAELFIWDDKKEGRRTIAERFPGSKIHIISPEQWPWKILDALVLSPGVPLTHPKPHQVAELAHNAGVRIIGDIELLCEAQPEAKKIAITGTNGKSTTTTLIGHILKNAGRKTEVGGNLGTAALTLAPQNNDGCYVLELSSYQLDLVKRARFNIAILLNITPDHIDRHGDMCGYVKAKTHIFDHQKEADFALVGIDDDYSRSVYAELKQTSKAKVTAVSVTQDLKQGVFVDKEGVLRDKIDPENPIALDLREITHLTGRHNWQNAAFAYAACKFYGLSMRDIEQGLKTFPGLRHRLQQINTIHGVRFINDSKATNADATSHALAPFTNIYWIAGGKAKEGGIASLASYFPQITHAFLIGDAEEAFAKTLDGKVAYTKCGTLANAFKAAADRAFEERKTNAVVLLSPACASFDQWKSFEERGDAFVTMAEQLMDSVIKGKR